MSSGATTLARHPRLSASPRSRWGLRWREGRARSRGGRAVGGRDRDPDSPGKPGVDRVRGRTASRWRGGGIRAPPNDRWLAVHAVRGHVRDRSRLRGAAGAGVVRSQPRAREGDDAASGRAQAARARARTAPRRDGSALRHAWIGDQLEASGELALPREGAESSGYAAYLRRAGIHTVLHAERVRLTGRRRGGLVGALDAVRRRAERGVSVGLDGSLAALARGMVLGADEDIPDRMNRGLQALRARARVGGERAERDTAGAARMAAARRPASAAAPRLGR